MNYTLSKKNNKSTCEESIMTEKENVSSEKQQYFAKKLLNACETYRGNR
jgi:hypothetical protein